MRSVLSEELLARLSALATGQLGLRFPPDRWKELARGLASAALELGIADFEGWAEGLAAGRHLPEHWAAIANHLTISETYFFRQRDAFDALEKQILPSRLARRREQARPLRIWSAGCASGEEPYSIAILLQQKFSELPSHAMSIVATDINSRTLGRAARGVYSEWSFRDAPEWLKDSYFTRKGATKFELVPEIRRRVRFVPLNLAAPLYPAEFGERGDFDVILCRNVLMYLSAGCQERIIQRFCAALAPGGWLVVGPCDLTAGHAAALHLAPISPGIYHQSDEPAGTEFTRAAPGIEATSAPAWALRELPPAVPAVPSVPAGMVAPVEPALTPTLAEHAAVPDASVAQELARAHADRGELELALAACDLALTGAKLNPNLHFLRGCILQEQQRWDDAVQAYHRVLFLDPAAVMAEFGLASLAQRAGREDEARRHYASVLRLLARHNLGEPVPRGEGLTVGRLRDVVHRALAHDAA